MTTDPVFTTSAMQEIFSAESRIAHFCRFEAELAASQAELGIMPAEAAEAIAAACAQPVSDPAKILRRGWEVGTPVVPLLEALRGRLSDDDAARIHAGATTQDVVDTAMVLQMRAGLEALDASLGSVTEELADLAAAHRTTAMMGRTFLQAAVPLSFGVRAALWLAPLVAQRRQIRDVSARLPLQLGGPVGDAASFGASRFELAERLAARLGLVAPVAPWHTDRTPVAEVAALLGRVASSVAKIAADVALLAQSEVGEITVRAGESSSMTHKRNPVDAIRAAAAAEVGQAMIAGLVAGRPHQLERGVGAWHAEWEMVPGAFRSVAAAVEATARCVGTLEIDRDRMAANAEGAEVADVGLIDRVLDDLRSLENR